MHNQPIGKIIVTRPGKQELKRVFGIDRTITVPGVNILPDEETVIHMKMHEFERPGQYEGNTVVQRCLVIANRACELLVTEFQGRPGKAIITAGKGDLHYETLLEKKLPHITPVDRYGVGDFGVLTRCETDESSGMLFLGRVLLAQEVGMFEEEPYHQLRPRKLSWASPESLYRSQDLNPVQRSILLWMKAKFGGR